MNLAKRAKFQFIHARVLYAYYLFPCKIPSGSRLVLFPITAWTCRACTLPEGSSSAAPGAAVRCTNRKSRWCTPAFRFAMEIYHIPIDSRAMLRAFAVTVVTIVLRSFDDAEPERILVLLGASRRFSEIAWCLHRARSRRGLTERPSLQASRSRCRCMLGVTRVCVRRAARRAHHTCTTMPTWYLPVHTRWRRWLDCNVRFPTLKSRGDLPLSCVKLSKLNRHRLSILSNLETKTFGNWRFDNRYHKRNVSWSYRSVIRYQKHNFL